MMPGIQAVDQRAQREEIQRAVLANIQASAHRLFLQTDFVVPQDLVPLALRLQKQFHDFAHRALAARRLR